MFYIVFELQKIVHISAIRCRLRRGLDQNVAYMWFIPLDGVTYFNLHKSRRQLEMLLIPNTLCWSSRKCNCACVLPAEVQLRLRVTRRSWQKLFVGKNFVKILVTAQTQLRSYSEQQRAFGNGNICNYVIIHFKYSPQRMFRSISFYLAFISLLRSWIGSGTESSLHLDFLHGSPLSCIQCNEDLKQFTYCHIYIKISYNVWKKMSHIFSLMVSYSILATHIPCYQWWHQWRAWGGIGPPAGTLPPLDGCHNWGWAVE